MSSRSPPSVTQVDRTAQQLLSKESDRGLNGIKKTSQVEQARSQSIRFDQIDMKQHTPDHETMDTAARLEFDLEAEAEMRDLWKDMACENGKSIDALIPKYVVYSEKPETEDQAQDRTARPDPRATKPPLRLSGGNPYYRRDPGRGPYQR